MLNLVAVGQTVWASLGGPKNLGDARSRPLSWGVSDPRNALHPTNVTVANLAGLSQRVGA